MENPEPTSKSSRPELRGAGFWQHRTLAELAEAQSVDPVEDVRVFYGTWPGEPDDGFDALIERLRVTA